MDFKSTIFFNGFLMSRFSTWGFVRIVSKANIKEPGNEFIELKLSG